jgi:hypothetical protein
VVVGVVEEGELEVDNKEYAVGKGQIDQIKEGQLVLGVEGAADEEAVSEEGGAEVVVEVEVEALVEVVALLVVAEEEVFLQQLLILLQQPQE